MICLYPKDGEEHIVLMQRNTHDQDRHSGQISLPGGKYEDTDLDLEHTARREFCEEMGVDAQTLELLGRLTDIYIPVSGFLVAAYVAFAKMPINFEPDRSEVDRIIQLPVKDLIDMDITRSTVTAGHMKIKVPSFVHHGDIIWGATSMILQEFRQLLR